MEEEIWAPVYKLENFYEVSTHGRIRNREGNILNQFKRQYGDSMVWMYNGRSRRNRSVTKVVAHTFLGFFEREIIYIDGNKSNNRLSNLKYAEFKKKCKQGDEIEKEIVKIKCLTCNCTFQSKHKQNRICGACKTTESWRGYGYHI